MGSGQIRIHFLYTFFFTIRGADSSSYSVMHGVPQGSVLGRLLYLLFCYPIRGGGGGGAFFGNMEKCSTSMLTIFKFIFPLTPILLNWLLLQGQKHVLKMSGFAGSRFFVAFGRDTLSKQVSR